MNNKVIIIEKIYQVVKYYQLVHGNNMNSEEYVTKLTNIKFEKINDDNVITFDYNDNKGIIYSIQQWKIGDFELSNIGERLNVQGDASYTVPGKASYIGKGNKSKRKKGKTNKIMKRKKGKKLLKCEK